MTRLIFLLCLSRSLLPSDARAETGAPTATESTTAAESKAVPSVDEHPDPPSATPYAKARARRTTGVVLTATGAAIAVTGLVVAVSSSVSMAPSCGEGQPDCNTGGAWGVFYGATLGVLSTPFLAVGIPLWVSGNKRMRANDDVASASLGLYRARDGGAQVVVSGRF